MIGLEFSPERNALLANQPNRIHVLIRLSSLLKHQEQNFDDSPPVNLAIVIDSSGSMNGQPLIEAKRCAAEIIDRMRAKDRLSIISYSVSADVVLPSRKLTDKEFAKNKVRQIVTGGMTDLFGGWHAGATQVANHLTREGISRILLLSDGCANIGITNTHEIAQHCAALAETGVTTSSYGLGASFNEHLMTAMARSGQGRAHYGMTAADLIDPFQEEFDLIRAIVGKKLRLHLQAEPGISIDNVNMYQIDQEGALILPDMASQGDVWVLTEIRIPESLVAQAIGSSVKVMTAYLSFNDLEGQHHSTAPSTLRLETVGPSAFEAIAVDPDVQSRTIELQAARLQDAAAIAARQGNWALVHRYIVELKEMGKTHEWINAAVTSLERYARTRERTRFSKEASYKSDKMRYRLADRSEHRSEYNQGSESSKPSFLRRKPEQGIRFDDGSNK